jgi:hypothetical protein
VAQGPRDYIDPNRYFPNTLLFMENSILQFLHALFGTFPPGEGLLHYDDNIDLTEILIEGQSTDNLREYVAEKPKIVVARGPVNLNPVGLNSHVGSALSRGIGGRRGSAPTIITGIRQGSVSISCFSREELEADRMAEVCASAIESLRDVVQRFGFLEIKAASIGQRGIVRQEAGKGTLAVTPVMLRVQITKNYNREKVDQAKLRHHILRFSVQPVDLNIDVKQGEEP